MRPDDLMARREADWRRLEALLEAAERGLKRLSEADLRDLGRHYRQAGSDLALAQRDFPAHPVTRYLNRLVGRAYPLIYQGAPLRRAALRRFAARDFPALFRRFLPYSATAALVFTAPAILAFALVARAPERIYGLAGPGIAPLVAEVEEGELWTEIAPAARSAASGAIMTNNIQVTFLAFAGGMTAGLLTLWVMLLNGLLLGAIFGLLRHHGLAAGLADFVVAHAFIELSVIFVAGGCGLAMADAILRPGLARRRDALAERAGPALRLLLGCAPLLVLAGLIEGFISPSSLPFAVKLAVGLGTGLALYAYWLGLGRGGGAD